MPATSTAHIDSKGASITSSKPPKATAVNASLVDETQPVRLHITPFTPSLLKAYLAPSVLLQAKNISYHTVATFPEKGFGYVELPAMEAQKLKKKLNGSTLKGSKIRIEEAKPEKRKAVEEADAADDKPAKRAKKEKKKKELGVLEGAELPADRKIKRGWTEPPSKNRRDRKKDEREKGIDKKDKKPKQKESKYTREPEMLFKAKLTPVAATELALKDKSKGKKEKKDKKNSKSKDETVLHEFEHNTKQPSFLKSTPILTEAKPAVEYVNGKGWVDEDGNLVESETGKARNRRVLELVDAVPEETNNTEKKPSITSETEASPKTTPNPVKKSKKKQATPPPSSSESELEESSAVSSSSEDEDSEPESEAASEAKSSASSPTPAEGTPEIAITPSSPDLERKEIHPLEALFKRAKPSPSSTPNPTSTPVKGLAPINTSFSFFENETEPMDVDDGDAHGNPPTTPYTQRDLEWRGLRSAAPTPDTAAIGRRFSFSWRKGSQEADDDDDDDDDLEAGKQLNTNTKANSSVNHLPGLVEEDEDGEAAVNGTPERDDQDIETNGTPLASKRQTRSTTKQAADGEEQEESEFGKWFWEARGDNNRGWKKRRRETLKVRRLRENKKLTLRKV
ncbi:hypothetical protein B0J11DRAFT_516311 [Dendryphion nanum]|uniref:Uncharacterized protein n=1 Tax=Dendryphion nanum TaxID=256645 RepID=A0A9P9EKM4_9PLEO|nr:hypothetical protein B0J11DRAFT_516311 [Dendryphion nanum]